MATYAPIIGSNMLVSISGAGTGAYAKTNVAGGNGRPSRTKFVCRVDALAFATDPTTSIVLSAPPGFTFAALGTANESAYLPALSYACANLAASAATVLPFMTVSAVNTSLQQLTVQFVVAAGSALSFFVEADFSHSLV